MNIYLAKDLYEYSELNWFLPYYDTENQTMFGKLDIFTPEGCRFMAKPRQEWVDSFYQVRPYFRHYKYDENSNRLYCPDWEHAPSMLAFGLFCHAYLRLYQKHICDLGPIRPIEDHNASYHHWLQESFLNTYPFLKLEFRYKILDRVTRDPHRGLIGHISRMIHGLLRFDYI